MHKVLCIMPTECSVIILRCAMPVAMAVRNGARAKKAIELDLDIVGRHQL